MIARNGFRCTSQNRWRDQADRLLLAANYLAACLEEKSKENPALLLIRNGNIQDDVNQEIIEMVDVFERAMKHE
ncbi:MAG: hypothetical protein NTZ74_12800 [Chloroflexi bacterium]|nr:hypothetical protein [Chloroflexota bacterium]